MFCERFSDKLLVVRQSGYFVQILLHAGLHVKTFLRKIRELSEKNLGQLSGGNGASESGKANFDPRFYSVFTNMHGCGFQNFLTHPAGRHQTAFSRTPCGSAVAASQSAVQTAEQVIFGCNSTVPVFKICGGNIALIAVYDPYPRGGCKGIALYVINAETVSSKIVFSFQNLVGFVALVVNFPQFCL